MDSSADQDAGLADHLIWMGKMDKEYATWATANYMAMWSTVPEGCRLRQDLKKNVIQRLKEKNDRC